MIKLNKPSECEVIKIKLNKNEHPIAWENKKKELIEQGMSEKEAENFIRYSVFEMEVFYSPNQGLFLVESEAVDSTTIYNPYDGTECPVEEDE